MKTKITILIILFFLVGCNNTPRKNKKDNDNLTSLNFGSANQDNKKSCEEFLDNYEQWMNTYIDLMSQYKDDPIAMVSSKEYSKLLGEGVNWLILWGQDHYSCIQDENYAKRFDAIQERSIQKQKELGLKN